MLEFPIIILMIQQNFIFSNISKW